MSTEEVTVKVEGHEHEIKSLKYRMEVREEGDSTQQSALSVEKIVLSTEHIMQEHKKQGERLKQLEGGRLRSARKSRWLSSQQ